MNSGVVVKKYKENALVMKTYNVLFQLIAVTIYDHTIRYVKIVKGEVAASVERQGFLGAYAPFF